MGKQYDKQHAATVIATATIAACRFIGFNGAHATSAGGAADSQGVSETDAAVGQAVSVITGYTAPVEAGGAFAQFDFVKADANGKAVVGTATDYCGRAMEASSGAGAFVEVMPLPARHA